jgi:hypothetical protein
VKPARLDVDRLVSRLDPDIPPALQAAEVRNSAVRLDRRQGHTAGRDQPHEVRPHHHRGEPHPVSLSDAGAVIDPVLELVVELDRERNQRLRQRGRERRWHSGTSHAETLRAREKCPTEALG